MITKSDEVLQLLESVYPHTVVEDGGLGAHFTASVRDEIDNIHLSLSRIGNVVKSIHDSDYDKEFSTMENGVLRLLSQFRKKMHLGYGA